MLWCGCYGLVRGLDVTSRVCLIDGPRASWTPARGPVCYFQPMTSLQRLYEAPHLLGSSPPPRVNPSSSPSPPDRPLGQGSSARRRRRPHPALESSSLFVRLLLFFFFRASFFVLNL
ncbi:hypothetical protein PVAP13_5NG038608 [Panicum virgatum]|uniref:Uncharacterized protein n=1 Tax=Panicum virgatum TaxID=38727 RepID=A0A8T0RMR4_PANVG|nr:hypothetical protein PVAP13_5NG038608 [Panicum virgatum]